MVALIYFEKPLLSTFNRVGKRKKLRQMKDENWDSFNGVFTLRQKSMCAFFICFLSSDSLIFFIQCHTYQIVMNIPGINSSSQTGSYGIMIPISTLIGF